jgi:hypothetical protein
LNLCTSCGTDFASVSAFDRHRIGKHLFTFAEGLAMSPPRLDGRRCMDADEMRLAGLERHGRGRWSVVADAGRIAAWAEAA